MYEFQIVIMEEKPKISNILLKELKEATSDFKTIITSYSEKEKTYITLACEEVEKPRLVFVIGDAVSDIVSTFFKLDFIEKNLKLPIQNKENINAFKKALIAFDRETDKYIITRALHFRNKIFIDSFYQFRLKALRSKWLEIIKLANDNAGYLLCNDTFVELLKFLIENIEISRGIVNVVKKEEDFVLCDEEFKRIDNNECLLFQLDEKNEFNLIASLIALSPKKINVYCNAFENNPIITLVSQIFDRRVSILPAEK